jgi:biopolymer transport protein ExbD
MRRGSWKNRPGRLNAGINLSPLLDVLFNLIFFFILATTFRDENVQIEVHLPGSVSADNQLKNRAPPVIIVTGENVVYYLNRALDDAQLQKELRTLVALGHQVVILRGDSGASYGRIYHLFDLCKQAGFRDVLLEGKRVSELGAG